jgi:hypothetical protein
MQCQRCHLCNANVAHSASRNRHQRVLNRGTAAASRTGNHWRKTCGMTARTPCVRQATRIDSIMHLRSRFADPPDGQSRLLHSHVCVSTPSGCSDGQRLRPMALHGALADLRRMADPIDVARGEAVASESCSPPFAHWICMICRMRRFVH